MDDPGAVLGYAALWLMRRQRPALRLPRRVAWAAYVVAGLSAGVVYELGLTVDGTGIGGLHRDTVTSFLLLPGYLAPAVGFTLLVAFYLASYAVYNGALGLLLVEPQSLWAAHPRPASRRWLATYSVVTGGVAWVCFGAWSLVVPGAG